MRRCRRLLLLGVTLLQPMPASQVNLSYIHPLSVDGVHAKKRRVVFNHVETCEMSSCKEGSTAANNEEDDATYDCIGRLGKGSEREERER